MLQTVPERPDTPCLPDISCSHSRRFLPGFGTAAGAASWDCEQHGCCDQAYMDVFTACLRKLHRPPSPTNTV